MDLEEKVLEALDRLTDQVSIEDGAILIGGFYAGMNGYTPLTAITKMFVLGDDANDAKKDAIIALFGIPGLAFASLLAALPTATTKMNAESDRSIAIDDMDPRRITSDYLYDRMMFIKNLKKQGEQAIQNNMNIITNKQLLIQQKNQQIDEIRHQIANEVEPEIIAYLRQQISNLQRDIMDLQDEIANLYRGMDVYKSQMGYYDIELKKVNIVLKKRDLALGAMGMVEAYALTRPGTLQSFGEILKGVGEIVPL